MPERGVGGLSFRYPSPTHAELVAIAEKQGVIMRVRDGSGKVIEGFFTKGIGGVMPSQMSQFHDGLDLKGGEFLSIHREADGRVRGLFPYKPYTQTDIDRITVHGTYSTPGNDVKQLQTLDGKPLGGENNPYLNLENNKGKVPFFYKAHEIDVETMRREYIDEKVRDARFVQEFREKYSDTYGAKNDFDEAKIREDAAKSFDEKVKSEHGKSKLFAETDELKRTNGKRFGDAPKLEPVVEPVKPPVKETPVAKEGGAPGQKSIHQTPEIVKERGVGKPGKVGGWLGLAFLSVGAVIAGTESIFKGESAGTAAMKAGDTLLPITAVSEGKFTEAGMQLTETATQFLVPIPGAGAAIGKAITDVPRQLLRANGFEVAPSTTEEYRERLKTEFSVTELRNGLLNPKSAIYKAAEKEYNQDYDKLVKQAGGNISVLPEREKFVKDQIRDAVKPLLQPNSAMDRVPSGVLRSSIASERQAESKVENKEERRVDDVDALFKRLTNVSVDAEVSEPAEYLRG